MRYTAQELYDILNDQDECDWIEAKGGSESSHSVMETVCSYCNEPGLRGGYIIMGVAEETGSENQLYKVVGVNDPDKFQRDFVSQCSSMFNFPVRADVSVEKINKKNVLMIWIDELPHRQKPLYFKTDGLPGGAMRRIGSTDQHCTEDDLHIFYQDQTSFDQTPVSGSSIDDVDDSALKRYRSLRRNVNPVAEELIYEDDELLQALGCVSKENKTQLNLAGLLLFGSSKAQRSNYPMIRADYIRIPGNNWIANPDDRFTSIDMRGSLILLIYRLIDAINADLPKGFLLDDNQIQAQSVGLPMKALREALVNALMHRSYREHRPTQVIRYDNRIEIINPGFSLKPKEKLGEPGSETRNPFIAAVFHDTNLAETKGSGIRSMRKLMEDAHLAPPTFDSSRQDNQFTARLLLHHFLDNKDIAWLEQFEEFTLNDAQKQALIFMREVGAIDNLTYRQMADCDVLHASNDLRALKVHKLFNAKGKGKATYYVAGNNLSVYLNEISTPPSEISTLPPEISAPVQGLSAPPPEISTPPTGKDASKKVVVEGVEIPVLIVDEINSLKQREHDEEKMKAIVKKLCAIQTLSANTISKILNKGEGYLKRKYLSQMVKNNELIYLHPDMINHPEQAYMTNTKK